MEREAIQIPGGEREEKRKEEEWKVEKKKRKEWRTCHWHESTLLPRGKPKIFLFFMVGGFKRKELKEEDGKKE